MIIGTTRELKNHEYRVGITPGNVHSYLAAGHQVLVEAGAGLGSGFSDEEYAAQGATLLPTAEEVWARSEMLIKVKEPEPEEYRLLRKGLILYTYLHLAACPELTDHLLSAGVNAVAYETIRDKMGSLPCLRPMSEIAGRLSIQEGAKYLEYAYGGRGILLGGVPGVKRGKVVIIGGGIAGTYAANAEDYAARIEKLDQEFADFFAGAGDRTMVFGDRFPLRYFAEEFDIDYYAAFPGCSTQTEPSAATIAFLTDKVRQEHIPTVWYIEFSNHLVADSIAESAGVRTAMFHTCHNVSAADLEAGATYVSLMEQNLETLREYL